MEVTNDQPRLKETATSSLLDLLNLIRSSTSMTRLELERRSNFSRSIVTARLATLCELGLVHENETGSTSGGRAPRLVQFAKDSGRICVVSLDQGAIGVGLANVSGELLTEHHEAHDLSEPPANTVERICELIDWSVSRHSEGNALWAISISVPGPVLSDSSPDLALKTPDFLPGWGQAKLVETLVERFQAPVWIRSSIETMTMGELHGGLGQGHRSLLFIKIGKRIGAGFVSNGQLYRGSTGAAGLIGQLPVHVNGQTKTLEEAAGSDMIAREGAGASHDGSSPLLAEIARRGVPISAVDICQAAQAGDHASVGIVTLSGRLIGGVVAHLVSMLNPEIIIFAGSVAQTNDVLLAAAREAIYGSSHPLVTRDLQILRSRMGSSAALLGAAHVAVEGLFEPRFLRRWILAGGPAQLAKRMLDTGLNHILDAEVKTRTSTAAK